MLDLIEVIFSVQFLLILIYLLFLCYSDRLCIPYFRLGKPVVLPFSLFA